AVADQELALTAADVHHAVDRLDARLQRLAHGLPLDDTGSDALYRPVVLGGDRPLAVDRLAERVDDAAHQRRPDRDRHDAARALDDVALADLGALAHQHRAHRVFLEVERDAQDTVRQFEQLAGHAPLEAVDARDAVAHGQHGARLGHLDAGAEAAELLADDLGDFFCADLHGLSDLAGRQAVRRERSALRRARTLPS